MDYIGAIEIFDLSDYTVFEVNNTLKYDKYTILTYENSQEFVIQTNKPSYIDTTYIENDKFAIITISGDYDSIYYYNKTEKLITHMYLNDWDWGRGELRVLNNYIETVLNF